MAPSIGVVLLSVEHVQPSHVVADGHREELGLVPGAPALPLVVQA